MVGIRKTLAILTVLMMIACTVPMAAGPMETDAAGDNGGVLLYQVNPWGDGEGFTLKNYSKNTVDLKGYSVSDGESEGSILFTESLKLGPSGTITVVMKKTDDAFSKQDGVYSVGESGIKKDRNFALSNSGDNLLLSDGNGTGLDAFYYGSFKGEKTGWVGENFAVKKTFFCQRSGTYDSDSADDWFNLVPGQTNLPLEPEKFTADVTPFLFPDSGGIPIYRALEKAEESVYIQMYELRSPNVYGLLVELEKKGVDVTILHEGSPVGNTVPKYIAPYMHYLIDNGGEVRFIGGTDNDRYENMHAKYAVIDGSTVIVTSENWSTTNMNGKLDDDPYRGQDGNRGWGAVVESPAYATYMMDVFNNDWSMEYGDTRDFMEVYGQSNVKEAYYVAPGQATFTRYTDVPITPVMSNDNSCEAISYFINGAQERVYSQQQSLTSYYADHTDESSPIHMMAQKAAAGVDARFILGGGFDSKAGSEAENKVLMINSGTLVSAAVMNDPYVHNKGLICDDTVWVSSINWTPTSVENNRECCVVLHSKEISDFFAEAFISDFELNYDFDGFTVDSSKIESSYESGKEAVFEVVVKPEGDYTYHWDFGDGGVRDTTIPKVAYAPEDGAHMLTVTVSNASGVVQTIEKDYYVGEDPSLPDKPSEPDNPAVPDNPGTPVVPDTPVEPENPGSPDSPAIPEIDEEALADFIPYLIPILAVLIALCIAVSKVRSKRKKSKGKKRE